MFWKGVLLFAVAVAGSTEDSIEQDQPTRKGLFDFDKPIYNDMDRSLVLIRNRFGKTCIGYRIHKLLVLSNTKCDLVYPKLDPKVIVTYRILKEKFYKLPKKVKAETSENPEDCGNLVFIRLENSKKLDDVKTVSLYEDKIAKFQVVECTIISWDHQKATGGFLKDVIFVAFEDNYLLKDELPGNLANPSNFIGSILYVRGELLGIGLSYNKGLDDPYYFIYVPKFKEGIEKVLNSYK